MPGRAKILPAERRKYVRLDSVFPVEFQLLSLDGNILLSEWIQGFTSDVGKGGMCLGVNNLKSELAVLIRTQQARLSLKIDMPIFGEPVKAQAKIAWIKDTPGQPRSYLIGLSYEVINTSHNAKILRYALAKKFFPAVSLSIIVLFAIALAFNAYFNYRLAKGNRALVQQLVGILQNSNIAKQKIKQISRDKDELQLKIQSLQQNIQSLDEEKLKKKEEANKIDQLNKLIAKLNQEKSFVQEQLINLQHKESTVTDELLSLEKKKVIVEKENFDKMYQWLKVHQNPRTGLVMSFEGDPSLNNWAFVYDQSLVAQVYANFSDFERARKILKFFASKADRQEGKFFNAYYADDGSAAEMVVHSGPNIWLGIAILQYTRKSKDASFLELAEQIASAIISLQDEDPEGGLRGGPNVSWYATEHNLDAYAFFNMLFKITKKEQYARARDKILKWLIGHTYDRTDIPIKRGKGDSTIATDTYAWSIAAIGPKKLEELGMNPDRIMEFAEANCVVEVYYNRPEGQSVKIKGFDFAPQRHVSRGGVVSSEWTAQMIISLRIMAGYYYQKNMPAKARVYEEKAEDYLANLGNMFISSPSPSGQGEACLPYATQDFVDTGHGWMTPKGKSTGSLAGTSYVLFAYYNYNPLELKE